MPSSDFSVESLAVSDSPKMNNFPTMADGELNSTPAQTQWTVSSDILDLVLFGTGSRSMEQDSLAGGAESRFQVPAEVRIGATTIPGLHHRLLLGVFARAFIQAGTQIGPYAGRRVWPWQLNFDHPLEMMMHGGTRLQNDFLWEVTGSTGLLDHFVDARLEQDINWMAQIKCARHISEQNLEMMHTGSAIYYRAIKDIPPGEELLVWYSRSHTNMYLDIPLFDFALFALPRHDHVTTPMNLLLHHSPPTIRHKPDDAKQDINHAMPTVGVHVTSSSHNADDFSATTTKTNETANSAPLRCRLCSKIFHTGSNLRSHMRTHTLERPFRCRYCSRGFSQSSTLRNHVRLHTGEKPYTCIQCNSSHSQLAGLRAHEKSVRHRAQTNAKL